MATNFHNAGVHVSTHAIGDRAIDWVVDTYAQALQAKPTKGLRHGIIHANTPTDHALDVIARLQRDYDAGFPEASAGFMWWIGDNYAGNFGPVRNLRMKPLATWQKRGIRWGGGSDFSVTPFAARYGIWASVARETLNGTYGKTPFGMAEAVDVRTALKLVHDLGRAHDLPRRPGRLDRSRQGRGPGGVGSRPVHRADRGPQGHEGRAHAREGTPGLPRPGIRRRALTNQHAGSKAQGTRLKAEKIVALCFAFCLLPSTFQVPSCSFSIRPNSGPLPSSSCLK